MSLSFYKPNSKNTGCGFSFQIGTDNKSKEPTLYVKSIKQHSWDSDKKQGYFSKNAGDPEKNIIVKFNEFECGEIINAIRKRVEYNTFHSFGEDKTVIKFAPWNKKSKKSYKDEDGQWKDKWIEVECYSLSFTRNGNQMFGIGIEPGEAEVIKQYLKFFLKKLIKDRVEKQELNFQKKDSSTQDEEAPF